MNTIISLNPITQRYTRVSNPKVRNDYFQGIAKVLENQRDAI